MDQLIMILDRALRVTGGVAFASRASPAVNAAETVLDERARRHSAALMRINHVGEICAQALYDAQGRFSCSEATRTQFLQAGREEEEHLAWTAERVRELGSHTSLLAPFWYAGSFALGVLAAKAGDAASLGFVVETERQVEAHLAGHLKSLPSNDAKSRAIVEQMRMDEREHGERARALGATEMPPPVRLAMRAMAKLMTTVTYYI